MQKILQFFKEVQEEFKHITWPKKETLIQLTFVVISISIITSLILGGFDYIFTNSIRLLGNLKTQPVNQIQTENNEATSSAVIIPTIVPTTPIKSN